MPKAFAERARRMARRILFILILFPIIEGHAGRPTEYKTALCTAIDPSARAARSRTGGPAVCQAKPGWRNLADPGVRGAPLEGGVGMKYGSANIGMTYSKEGGFGGDVGVELGGIGTVGVSYNEAEGAGVNASLSGVGDLDGFGLDLSYTQNTGLSAGVNFTSDSNVKTGLTWSETEGIGTNVGYTRDLGSGTSATGSLSWTQNSGTSANLSGSYENRGSNFEGASGGIGWSQNNGLSANVGVAGTNAFNWDETSGWTGNANYMMDKFEQDRVRLIKEEQKERREKAAEALAEETDNIRDVLAEETGKSPEELAEMSPQELHDLAESTPGAMGALLDAGYGFDVDGSRDGESWLSRNMGAIVDEVTNSFGGASNDLVVREGGKFKIRTCFVAGTLVRVHPNTPGARSINGKSFKDIETIEVGERVLAWNEETGELTWRAVLKTYVRRVKQIYRIKYADGTSIDTTWNHPFYIEGRGWVIAEDLKQGDASLTALDRAPGRNLAATGTSDSTKRIDTIQIIDRATPETVYNFTVEIDHNYFVSEAEILVHNGKYGKSFQEEMYKRTIAVLEKAKNDPAAFAAEIAKNGTKDGLLMMACLPCQQAIQGAGLAKELFAATGAQGKEEMARSHARLTLKGLEMGGAFLGGRFLGKVLSSVKVGGKGKGGQGATNQKKKSEADQVDLDKRAKEIHGTLTERTQRSTTTAVGRVRNKDGTKEIIVGSSEPRLRKAQREALKQGETEAKGPGHAEMTIINQARQKK